jgi:hypothetical protein
MTSSSVRRTCALEGCEATFRVYPSQIAKGQGHFCSVACRGAATKEKNRITRACERPGCEATFKVSPADIKRGRGRFCSPDCAYVARRSRRQALDVHGVTSDTNIPGVRLQRTSRPKTSTLSNAPKLRTERPGPTPPSELTHEPRLDVAAIEVSWFIEKTGLSIEDLGARIDRLSTKLGTEGSGARSIRRIIADVELVDIRRADELAIAVGTVLGQTGLTALATSPAAARAAVRVRAELDEETISDAALERRAQALLHFSLGFLRGIELEPNAERSEATGAQQDREEVAA